MMVNESIVSGIEIKLNLEIFVLSNILIGNIA